jgi:hypothetical protein
MQVTYKEPLAVVSSGQATTKLHDVSDRGPGPNSVPSGLRSAEVWPSRWIMAMMRAHWDVLIGIKR